MTAGSSELKVGRTEAGYCIRVEGHGTLRQSPAVLAFAGEAMCREAVPVVVDLSGCDYLDSTFLGCVVTLHRQFGGARFAIAGPAEVRHNLFGPTRLDRLLRATDAPPAVVGPWVPLPAVELSAPELSRHVMESHRRLAEVEGPNREAFQRIADQIAKDLLAGGRLRG